MAFKLAGMAAGKGAALAKVGTAAAGLGASVGINKKQLQGAAQGFGKQLVGAASAGLQQRANRMASGLQAKIAGGPALPSPTPPSVALAKPATNASCPCAHV